ncbi:CBS domain-containing protein [Hydrogenovibrio kuenenii]|uniref:CBS domain-containing protein n=1 Tax=Hydrogenovibrio kuenenii TaxID=63658 RepID=UPI0004637ACE|nr:CBS domain-containing protein [Hydrogenovibrio kuenenii]
MFIVYSPEGQSYIGAAQVHPELKVDPVARVSPVSDSEFEEMHMSPEESEKNKKSHEAIHQYQTVKEGDARHVVARVGEIMSSPVFIIAESDSLLDAWELMTQHNIHHLPVLNDAEVLVGMISYHEILQRAIVSHDGQIEEIRQETVAQWMHKEVITTLKKTDIRKVAQVMAQYQIGSVVIMSEEKQLLGIVTLSDLVKRLAEEPPLTVYA